MMNKVPKHLKHKPMYAINGYAAVDGYYKNKTDVVGLSVGKAQWSKDTFIPSVKVWRRKNKRWSRQSEETTFTRALDMVTLIIKVLDKHYNGQELEPIKTVYGNIDVEQYEEYTQADIAAFDAYLQEHKDDIGAHLELLQTAIRSYCENSLVKKA